MRVLMTVLLLLLMAFSGASAQSDDPRDLLALAQLTPADSELFFAARIDDDYLATLDGLVATLAGAGADLGMTLPDSLPRIQDLVASNIDPNATPEQVDAALALLGDTAAVSMRMVDDGTVFGLYLTITDREALVAAINPIGLGLNEAGVIGRFTLYRTPNAPTALLVADDIAILTDDDAALIASGDYPKLAELPTFVGAAAALPVSSYNLLTYASASSVTNALNNEDIFTRPGGLMLGATILDSGALSLDFAFVPTELDPFTVQTIDPAFARFISAEANAVIHSTNFGAGIQTLVALNEQSSGQDLIASLDFVFAALGVTYEEFLTLTSGSYAIFSNFDLRAALEAGSATNPAVLADHFEIALVIEATDPALMSEFTGRIGRILQDSPQDQGFTVSTVTVGETDVTRIDLVVPDANIPLALGIAATEEVFVVGTFGAVEDVLAASGTAELGGLSAVLDIVSGEPSTSLDDASLDLLPDPAFIAYADGSAFSSVFLALFGVSSVVTTSFDTVEEAMDDTATPSAETVVVEDLTPQVLMAYDRLVQLLRYGTISATLNGDGVVILRATIALGE